MINISRLKLNYQSNWNFQHFSYILFAIPLQSSERIITFYKFVNEKQYKSIVGRGTLRKVWMDNW